MGVQNNLKCTLILSINVTLPGSWVTLFVFRSNSEGGAVGCPQLWTQEWLLVVVKGLVSGIEPMPHI